MIHLFHSEPNHTGLVAIPIGQFYNKEIQEAKVGDEVMFLGRDKVYRIIDKATIPINTDVGHFMMRYLYDAKIENVIRRWKQHAEYMGFRPSVIDTKICLLVRVTPK